MRRRSRRIFGGQLDDIWRKNRRNLKGKTDEKTSRLLFLFLKSNITRIFPLVFLLLLEEPINLSNLVFRRRRRVVLSSSTWL